MHLSSPSSLFRGEKKGGERSRLGRDNPDRGAVLEPRPRATARRVKGSFFLRSNGGAPLSLSISFARRKLVRPVAQSEDREAPSFRETCAQ